MSTNLPVCIMVICCMASCTDPRPEAEYESLIQQLGDEKLTLEERFKAQQKLARVRDDDSLIDLLVSHTEDLRVFNAQAQRPQSGPDDNETYVQTVGDVCAAKLHAMLCENQLSTYPTECIENWRAWRARHASKTVAELRALISEWEKSRRH